MCVCHLKQRHAVHARRHGRMIRFIARMVFPILPHISQLPISKAAATTNTYEGPCMVHSLSHTHKRKSHRTPLCAECAVLRYSRLARCWLRPITVCTYVLYRSTAITLHDATTLFVTTTHHQTSFTYDVIHVAGSLLFLGCTFIIPLDHRIVVIRLRIRGCCCVVCGV